MSSNPHVGAFDVLGMKAIATIVNHINMTTDMYSLRSIEANVYTTQLPNGTVYYQNINVHMIMICIGTVRERQMYSQNPVVQQQVLCVCQ
jgi:hypothetical protein